MLSRRSEGLTARERRKNFVVQITNEIQEQNFLDGYYELRWFKPGTITNLRKSWFVVRILTFWEKQRTREFV